MNKREKKEKEKKESHMNEGEGEKVSLRDANALRVLDAGTGRVRLPLAVMERLDVLPGDCVLLSCTKPSAPWSVLGRAWPWPAQYTATDAAAADVRVVVPPADTPLARTTLAELARRTGLRLNGASASPTTSSTAEEEGPREGAVRVVARGPFAACAALTLAPATARTAAFVQEDADTAAAVVRALLRTVVVAPHALVLVPCLAASVHPAAPAAPSLVFAVTAASTSRTPQLAPGTVTVVTANTAVSFAPLLAQAPSATSPTATAAPAKPTSEETVGGLSAELQTLREAVSATLSGDSSSGSGADEDLFARGILLKGEPGVGKTLMVREVARECDARVFAINGPEVLGCRVGESEDALRRIFASALAAAAKSETVNDEEQEQDDKKNKEDEEEQDEEEEEEEEKKKPKKPVIIFIDEIDSLCPARGKEGAVGGGSLVEGRVVAQVVSLFDRVRRARYRVVVVAATNRANAVDSALRRPGRFDVEIEVPVPSLAARRDILRVCTAHMPLTTGSSPDAVDLDAIAARCVGYVGADLAALCREAALAAMRAGCDAVGREHFFSALQRVTPSTRRTRDAVAVSNAEDAGGGSATTAPTWDDIGGLESVKQELREALEWPLQHAAALARLGVRPPRGVLLHGPPGSGKTTLVRAAAAACHASFFSVSGASVYSAYLGDAEAAVRRLFRRARTSTPAIVFIDEIDAIMGSRSGGGGGEGGSDEVRERVLSTLMNEMDGVEALRGVLVVAATNRPDLLDDALVRAGRFDRRIYIGAPDRAAAEQILRIHARRIPLDASVDLAAVARRVVGCSGADLACICREAAMASLRESVCFRSFLVRSFSLISRICVCVHFHQQQLENTSVSMKHFDEAVEVVLGTNFSTAATTTTTTTTAEGNKQGQQQHTNEHSQSDWAAQLASQCSAEVKPLVDLTEDGSL